jgi:hypothetical protein
MSRTQLRHAELLKGRMNRLRALISAGSLFAASSLPAMKGGRSGDRRAYSIAITEGQTTTVDATK